MAPCPRPRIVRRSPSTVVPAGDGAKRVVSATAISAPVETAISSTHEVYVALVVPAGLTADPAITQTSARAMVTTVSRYWSGQTGANVSFNTAQVMPAYSSAYGCTGTFANTFQMWEEALARMPEAFGPGKHLVLIAPGAAYAHHCFYGLGTVGAIEYEGNEVFVSGLNQSLLAHELGHNLGLYHSNSLRCSGAQDMAMVGIAFPGCQANAYDDLFDVMGYSGSTYGEGSLNAVHLDGMNLLPNAVRKIEADSGVTTARITPLSTSTDNRTLKITDPSGADYFVEYRTNSGLDAVASRNPWRPAWGVRVLRDNPEAPPSGGAAAGRSLGIISQYPNTPGRSPGIATGDRVQARVCPILHEVVGAAGISDLQRPVVCAGRQRGDPGRGHSGVGLDLADRVGQQVHPIEVDRVQAALTVGRSGVSHHVEQVVVGVGLAAGERDADHRHVLGAAAPKGVGVVQIQVVN